MSSNSRHKNKLTFIHNGLFHCDNKNESMNSCYKYFSIQYYFLLHKKYLRQQMMSQVLNLSLKLFFNWE